MHLKNKKRLAALSMCAVLTFLSVAPSIVGCSSPQGKIEASIEESGSLGTPNEELPRDPEKAPAPANPQTSLLKMSQKQYSEGNLGCKKITVLSEYNVGIDYDTYSYRDADNKIFYLFIPCRADMSKITFSVTHRDGSTSGPYTADFSDDKSGENELVMGTTSQYTVIALQSNLPTMMIQVDETYGTLDDMYDDTYHNTHVYGDMVTTVTDEMATQNGLTTRYISVDENADKKCSLDMRGRGNATWGYEKRPYQIKTENSLDLLGLGRQDTFVLLANFNDASFLRNQLASEFSLAIGMDYTPRCQQLDLFINGEYMGLYLLSEKCDIGENRIEIDKNKDILYEINQRYEEYGEFGFLSNFESLGKVRIHSPEDPSRISNVQSIFYRAERALYGIDEEEFLTFFDLESWAKMYIIQELTMNHDAYWGSLYFYYDHTDGKLHACAPWDFDYSWGISWAKEESRQQIEDPTRYSVDSHYMIKRMLRFDSFKEKVVEVYYRQETQKALSSMKKRITELSKENRASAEMNFVGSTYRTSRYPYEYNEAVDYLRTKVLPRIEWLDNKIANFKN